MEYLDCRSLSIRPDPDVGVPEYTDAEPAHQLEPADEIARRLP
ncbi:hypothetical protein AB0D57_18550 [Streptomyces sp. NPDC048275]